MSSRIVMSGLTVVGFRLMTSRTFLPSMVFRIDDSFLD
jgi:hypothetical protein